ncbi:MAG TPA: winged helix-turn-helix domain-containing protein [Ktedonobacterales bacterium]|nr:winged helix-turn-helix domain-containing protein [Ktedonobacterales bacterium]
MDGLRRHPAPGRQPRLSAAQLAQLPALVERGPEAYGFRRQVWPCRRVAEVIRRTFGVTYHPAHVSRLLHAVRHSVQRPVTRATQRNEATIAAWWRERWPALEKKRPTTGVPSSG